MRYSRTAHDAPPALKTAWRIERRLRHEAGRIRKHLWLGTYIVAGNVFISTTIGVLYVTGSGSIRRAVEA